MNSSIQDIWFYKIEGDKLRLWKLVSNDGNIVNLGDYKVSLPDSVYGRELIYPDETILKGLQFRFTKRTSPFVSTDPETNDSPSAVAAAPDELSFIRFRSRILQLAVVDYVKAKAAEREGNMQVKEYYMKSFWKKIGDEHSNRYTTGASQSMAHTPYAIR